MSDQSPMPIPIPSPGRVRAEAQRCASSRHVGAEAAGDSAPDDDQAVVLRMQSGMSGCGLVEDARGGDYLAEQQEVVWFRIDSVDMFGEARILACARARRTLVKHQDCRVCCTPWLKATCE